MFQSYLFLPYVPLHALDMLLEFRRQPEGDIAPDPLALGGRRVRGFLCGTTNPLLSQNTRLAEVIVNTLPFPSEISGRDIPVEGNLEIAGDSEMESSDPSQKGPSLNKPGGVFSRLLVSESFILSHLALSRTIKNHYRLFLESSTIHNSDMSLFSRTRQ